VWPRHRILLQAQLEAEKSSVAFAKELLAASGAEKAKLEQEVIQLKAMGASTTNTCTVCAHVMLQRYNKHLHRLRSCDVVPFQFTGW
jgi:hypothetical protein